MHRRSPLTRSFTAFAIVLASAVFPGRALGQRDDSLTVRHVAGTVYMIEGAGDVIAASAGADGILLVDDGFPETVERLRLALRALSEGPVRIVINTHWHHAGANEDFAKEAVIVAHRNTRTRLADTSLMYGRPVAPIGVVGLPDITFTDSMTMHFNGEAIQLIHLPAAHTDGDVGVFFTGSNVVALGDVFVTEIGVTDYTSGGTLSALVGAIDRLLDRVPPDTWIIPGHGHLARFEDLVTYREVLGGMIELVSTGMDAGLTLADLVAARLPEPWRQRLDILPEAFVIENFYEGVQRARGTK